MICPKCHSSMKSQSLETNAGTVTVDQCSRCNGIWFDSGEAEILKEEWRSLFLDTGDPEVGKIYNEIKDIDCPRCNEPMHHQKDVRQNHIGYEVCLDHGVFMDAGEFSDYKVISVLESVQNLIKNVKKNTK